MNSENKSVPIFYNDTLWGELGDGFLYRQEGNGWMRREWGDDRLMLKQAA